MLVRNNSSSSSELGRSYVKIKRDRPQSNRAKFAIIDDKRTFYTSPRFVQLRNKNQTNTYRINPARPKSQESKYSSIQEYEYAGQKSKINGHKYSEREDGPPTRINGYADLKLVEDQKFRQESRYVRDTLKGFGKRRNTLGAAYLNGR